MDPKLSLKSEQEMSQTLDFVVQQVADGKLTAKQGDVVNTSCKQVLKMHDLKLKYLNFYYLVHKKAVEGGSASLDMVFKKLPGFFLDDAQEARKAIAADGRKKLS